MGVFDCTFILPPQHMRFNYFDPPTIKSNYVNPITHITHFFSGEPTSKEIEQFFVYKTRTTHKIPFERGISTELHFREGQPPTELHFHEIQTPIGLKNNQLPPTPQNYIALPSKTPIFFHLEQPSLSTRIHVNSGCSLNETRSCMLNLIMSYKSHPKTS